MSLSGERVRSRQYASRPLFSDPGAAVAGGGTAGHVWPPAATSKPGRQHSHRGRRRHCSELCNPVGDLPGNFADWVTAHGADDPEWRESLEELSERLRAALQ